MSRYWSFVPLLLATGVVLADEVPPAERDAGAAEAQQTEDPQKKDGDPKTLSGMSVLGNQEAPKALVIVPWKSSALGDSVGISLMLDDSRLPVDREVFLRSLSYYEIRSGSRVTAAAESDATQHAAAAPRRKK
jgi:hypothetical protein